jgi:hypothetical protein
MIAAEVLGRRRERSSIVPLRSLVMTSTDPYLAAQALESLVEIEGAEVLHDFLLELSTSAAVQVRNVAQEALSVRR